MDSILPSGAKLHITVAPFADAHALLKAILRSVKGLKLGDGAMDVDMSLEGLKKSTPEFLSEIISKILAVATSDEVEAFIFKCLERVTYDGVKINRELFDDPKIGPRMREDYYTICYRVIEANCKPFFVKTFSGLSVSAPTPESSPK